MQQITEISNERESFKDLHEEEEESESETENGGELRCRETEASDQPVFNMTREMQQMIQNLWDGVRPQDNGMDTMSDAKLNELSYLDFKGLHKACAKLTVKLKDKMLDVVFWGCITAMVGVINLYMSSEFSYTWQEASLVVSKSKPCMEHMHLDPLLSPSSKIPTPSLWHILVLNP